MSETEERLTFRGDLDPAACARLRRDLPRLALDSRSLTIDLRRITFLDCSAARVLVAVHDALAAVRTVRFQIAPAGQPHRLIVLMGLERSLGILDPTAPDSAPSP